MPSSVTNRTQWWAQFFVTIVDKALHMTLGLHCSSISIKRIAPLHFFGTHDRGKRQGDDETFQFFTKECVVMAKKLNPSAAIYNVSFHFFKTFSFRCTSSASLHWTKHPVQCDVFLGESAILDLTEVTDISVGEGSIYLISLVDCMWISPKKRTNTLQFVSIISLSGHCRKFPWNFRFPSGYYKVL